MGWTRPVLIGNRLLGGRSFIRALQPVIDSLCDPFQTLTSRDAGRFWALLFFDESQNKERLSRRSEEQIMANAKDLMTPNPLVLQSGMELEEAVELFNKLHISTAPVVTPIGEVLGQLTEMDLVKAVVHHRVQGAKYSKVIHAQEFFLPVRYVEETQPIGEVLREMMKTTSHRVLVRNLQEKLVGVISPKDILRSLYGEERVANRLAEECQKLNIEVVELRSRLKEMSVYLSTYDSVFQSGLYMLHSIDPTGHIIFANDKIHSALGYEPGELIGKSIKDLYPPSVQHEAIAGLKRVIEEGQHQLTYSSMVCKNGGTIRVDLASAALKDDQGRFLGTFTISREYGSEAMLRALHGIFPTQDVDSAASKSVDVTQSSSKNRKVNQGS